MLDGLRLLSNFLALERECRSGAGVEAVLLTRGVGEKGRTSATVVLWGHAPGSPRAPETLLLKGL